MPHFLACSMARTLTSLSISGATLQVPAIWACYGRRIEVYLDMFPTTSGSACQLRIRMGLLPSPSLRSRSEENVNVGVGVGGGGGEGEGEWERVEKLGMGVGVCTSRRVCPSPVPMTVQGTFGPIFARQPNRRCSHWMDYIRQGR